MHSLSESLKVTLNPSTNASKSFNDGNCHFNKGANYVKVVLHNNVQ